MAETSLIEQLKCHLEPTLLTFPGLRPADFRLHNFTDADMTTKTPVILLRRSGTGGDDDDIAQQIDVDVVILVGPAQIKEGENLTHTLRLFLKSEAGAFAEGVYGYVVYSHIIGPVQLQNGRHRFMFMVRCFTENQ